MSDWNKMQFVIGYNESDISFGWDGSSKSFVLYFSHFTDEHINLDNQIPLSPGLMPEVIFKTVKREYIGFPFTPCKNNSFAINRYDEWDDRAQYSQRFGISVFLRILIIFCCFDKYLPRPYLVIAN